MKKYLLPILITLGLLTTGVTYAAMQRIYIGAIGSNSDAALLWDNTNRRFSINSSTPYATLAVQGSSTAPTIPIFIAASSTGSQIFKISADRSIDLYNSVLTLRTTDLYFDDGGTPRDFLVTVNSQVTVNGNGSNLVLQAAAGDGTGDGGNVKVQLGDGSPDGAFQVYIAGAGTPSVVVSATGNLGVGTTTPGNALSVVGGISSSVLTNTSIPLVGAGGLLGNSSLSQSGGTTLINGATPIINGGGIWLSDILQLSGANFIVQTPTSTAVLGNLVQGGGVQYFTTSTSVTPTQFCTGGLINVASTSDTTLTLPALTQLGLGFAPSDCTNSIYSGNFAQQFQVNTGSGNNTLVASGSNETLLFGIGSGPVLNQGEANYAVGQFVATSTIRGATTTGMSLNVYLASFQKRATNPTIQGQFLTASSTVSTNEWVVTNFVAGSNITITTTTPGQVTIASSGGGSGNSAWTIGSGLIYNATSTDEVGIGTSTPIATVDIQGNGATIPFRVSSSTGPTMLSVIPTVLPGLYVNTTTTANLANVYVQGTTASTTAPLMIIASTTAAELMRVEFNGRVGINSSTPRFLLSVNGTVGFQGLTTAAGTPNSICQNGANSEVTVNAALTCTVSSRTQKIEKGYLQGDYTRVLLDLKPTEFAYKDQPNRLRWGFYAEDVAEADPRLADGWKDGKPGSLDQNAILALTVKTVQEQQAQIDELKQGKAPLWPYLGLLGLLGLIPLFKKHD